MATFYKYAERSAESQVNWAEIGKNMTDMLRDEVTLREEKKAAIDEATRKYAEELSNAPQGEHVGAKTEALRFADQASKYMLQQERLLKSGLLDPKDYMVARQNLVDGTKRAFGAMKAFQAQYGELMERAQTDKSSALELDNLEEVQGYGNFSQSGFFIDAPTGKVNVALKEEQEIDGEKVIGLKQGSTRGMEYIDGSIYGRIDKFKPREALVGIAETLGEEIRASLSPGTLSKIGSIKSVEDLRQRTDIDPTDKTILFEFYSSIKSSVNTVMANPLQKASLLRDTLGYTTTLDAAAAAKDPKLILKVINPATGRGEYQFSEAQNKEAEKWMTGQLLGMIDRKETISSTGVIPRQDPSAATTGRQDEKAEARIFGENLAMALKSNDPAAVENAVKYLANKSGRLVRKTANGFIISDLDGTKQSTFNYKVGDKIADPDKLAKNMISAFGTKLPEDTIIDTVIGTLKGSPLETVTFAEGFDVAQKPKKENPVTRFNNSLTADLNEPTLVEELSDISDDSAFRDAINASPLANKYGITFESAYEGNNIYIKAGDGRPESPLFPVKDSATNQKTLKSIEAWLKKNYLKGATLEEKEAAAEGFLGPAEEGGVMSNY
jgi:hypothetical protein